MYGKGIVLDDNTYSLLVITEGPGSWACTIVHGPLGRETIGGCRFLTSGTFAEVGKLSKTMSDKCRAASIEAGGQKTIVCAVPELLASPASKADMLAAHIREVLAIHPHAIFGPDMGANEDLMDEVSRRAGIGAHVTGLGEGCGGIAIDKIGLTAIGVAQAVETASDKVNLPNRTVAIQGFGAVGSNVARLLDDRGFHVVAISNVLGTVYAQHNGRLPIELMCNEYERSGDAGLISVAAGSTGTAITESPAALFAMPADILIPAARTSCLAMSGELNTIQCENPDVMDVSMMMQAMKPKLVVEAANCPLTAQARRYLSEQGVVVLEDFLVNCGGLIGCWLEWKNRAVEMPLSIAAVRSQSIERVRDTVRRNVMDVLQETSMHSRNIKAANV